eukprot:3820557-Amphidinium_carterae.1
MEVQFGTKVLYSINQDSTILKLNTSISSAYASWFRLPAAVYCLLCRLYDVNGLDVKHAHAQSSWQALQRN